MIVYLAVNSYWFLHWLLRTMQESERRLDDRCIRCSSFPRHVTFFMHSFSDPWRCLSIGCSIRRGHRTILSVPETNQSAAPKALRVGCSLDNTSYSNFRVDCFLHLPESSSKTVPASLVAKPCYFQDLHSVIWMIIFTLLLTIYLQF